MTDFVEHNLWAEMYGYPLIINFSIVKSLTVPRIHS